MKIAVLGTGTVGTTVATGWLALGHEVRLGSRTADNENALSWLATVDEGGGVGTFADVAAWGEVIVNATSGEASVAVVTGVAEQAAGKVLIDISNPLDFSHGFPPTLSVVNDDSLAEQLQRAVPAARVVKALNTLTADLMLNPAALPEPTDLFLAGDDQEAKDVVRGLLTQAGWESAHIHDLGGIEAARGPEMWLPLWLRIMGAVGNPTFNVRIVRG
jgi:8-hydroxy-5-deazaflavin:NADPH oxidoreductase